MLKTIHKYQRSIILYVIMGAIFIAMLGFGVDFMGSGRPQYAIKIDETEIDMNDFFRQHRALIELYRRQLGGAYNELVERGEINTRQQVVDSLIPGFLMERFAREMGFAIGKEELRELLSGRFGGQFNRALYQGYLQQIGMTAPAFEAQLASDAMKAQLNQLFSDMSRAAAAEAHVLLERDQTSYTVNSVELNPEDAVPDLPKPEAAVLDEFYEKNATRYERPERISYAYTVLDPKDYLKLVQVFPEDIELYYTDHQHEFMTSARAKVRHIQLNFFEGDPEEKLAQVRQTAEDIHSQVSAGEDFAALAQAYSDDIKTRFEGGALGWIKQGEKPRSFDAAVFALQEPGIAELVSDRSAYHIVQVEELQPAAPMELKQVQPRIERALRLQDAPAYTAEKAAEYFEQWQAAGAALADFAKKNKLNVKDTEQLLARDSDPADVLQGLTAQVIVNPDTIAQLIEVGEKSVLVEVKDYGEADIAPLEEIREQVQADYLLEQAVAQTRELADQLLAGLQDGTHENLEAAAKTVGAEVLKTADLKRSEVGVAPPFAEEKLRDAVFTVYEAGQPPRSVVEHEGRFYLVQVTAIEKPNVEELQEQVKEYQERQSGNNTSVLQTSVINQLKAAAEIDINPSILEN